MTLQRHDLDGDRIFDIPGFLEPEECERFIALSEGLGYQDAPITTAAGFVMRKDVRDNVRVMWDDTELAAHFYKRLESFIPRTARWQACGLNERWRFYRYDVGQQFRLHSDGCFRRSAIEESQFTFMIYLNDDFKGGETNFYDNDGNPRCSVTPETGKALVFWHYQLHEGAAVSEGRKYVLRSDVMFRRDR